MNFHKNLLLLLLIVFTTLISKAQQNVTFDLNTSTFNSKLSYLELVTIEGLPIKDGKLVDIIQLKIKSYSNKERKNILA